MVPAGGSAFGLVARLPEKNAPQTSRCTAAEGNRQNRRLEAELINGADILTHVVDSIPAADRRGVMPENIPGETNSRSPPSRRVVAESGTAGRPGKPSHIQPACALRINEGMPYRSSSV